MVLSLVSFATYLSLLASLMCMTDHQRWSYPELADAQHAQEYIEPGPSLNSQIAQRCTCVVALQHLLWKLS